ncbi:hypothetical protein NE237_006440 [Protea cynaroides]|uniref:Uncharacterized protein n=1 Tax=Protea cynaroides TaxID=273540 RepID=A0A9Q0KN76_9MAGN|nr:hypothetical protein NE237_006440 [Protea cynaroides]
MVDEFLSGRNKGMFPVRGEIHAIWHVLSFVAIGGDEAPELQKSAPTIQATLFGRTGSKMQSSIVFMAGGLENHCRALATSNLRWVPSTTIVFMARGTATVAVGMPTGLGSVMHVNKLLLHARGEADTAVAMGVVEQSLLKDMRSCMCVRGACLQNGL